MNIRYPISEALVAFAREESVLLVPKARTAGFQDATERGSGDLLDHVGTLAAFRFLVEQGCWVRREITAGPGDEYDIAVLVRDKWETVNVKTSRYAPVHERLHLMIKKEDLRKVISGYMQVFVHLDEKEDPEPHVHFSGYANQRMISPEPLTALPNTDGHPGVQIRLSALRTMEDLVKAAKHVI